ncbi:MAG: hypothetical protein ABI678_02635 [Kofleriaceae bacterium]
MSGLRTWVFVLAVAACADVANAPIGGPTLDETVFRCKAQPVLVAQCSYNACHGVSESALRVYAVGKLRASPPADSVALAAPLTEAEQHANYLNAIGFATYDVAPVDNWLLRKPLPPGSGGYEHAGGAIYIGTGDPNYVALFQWLNGGGTCN